jgi:dTDP-4-amino-4,6-dideoxygalactose transaminase
MIQTTLLHPSAALARPARPRVPFLDLKAQYALIRDEILDAVHTVLESGRYVGGEQVERFEEEFARYVGARYAVALSSGTAALELTLRALGIRAGDEVIVPAYTFFATAEAVSLIGAKPVFADVDPLTCHLDAASAERRITSRTRAILPVHLHGRAMEMNEIIHLAHTCGLLVVEDACQAHGVRSGGVCVGGSGRPTCFSFYPGKNLGAFGDGGAVTCNDAALARKLRLLRDHGSPTKYEHVAISTNARMDAVQAAVLRVKLRWLDEWNGRRARHAKTYIQALKQTGIVLPAHAPTGGHNYHLFVIRSSERDELRAFLAQRGIETGIHYPTPLHLTRAYQELGYPGPGSLPNAEAVTREVISLPIYPELTREEIRDVTFAIREFMTVWRGAGKVQPPQARRSTVVLRAPLSDAHN